VNKERRLVVVAIAAVTVAAVATAFFTPSQTTLPIPEPGRSDGNNTRSGVQVLAENLDVPWAIDIAEDGRLFFTEREGRIMAMEKNGSLISDPVSYINVLQNGESGLLGLALHPNFTENHLLYVYHTYSNGCTQASTGLRAMMRSILLNRGLITAGPSKIAMPRSLKSR
jgi:glucose/arabinose dehydrogenase